jgi:hypothetical protein
MIPILEYEVKGNQLRYRYNNIVKGFDMPLKININGNEDWYYPSAAWKSKIYEKGIRSIQVNENFYVETKSI